MARTLYLVGHNMAGYMPESDPYIVSTLRAAIRASRNDAERSVEDSCGESAEYRETLSGSRGDYWVSGTDGPAYHYWVTPMLAELRIAGDAVDRAYRRYALARCSCCERELTGERAYWVGDADCYVCRDCV